MPISSESTSPIKDFIQSALSQINGAIPKNARIEGVIKFEISTVVQKEKNGGIDISVINLGANISENQIQKIIIPIQILTDTAIAQNAARIAKAEAEISQAIFDKCMTDIKK